MDSKHASASYRTRPAPFPNANGIKELTFVEATLGDCFAHHKEMQGAGRNTRSEIHFFSTLQLKYSNWPEVVSDM